MDKKIPFIQELVINKVRHLKDITIKIDKERARTLILTGPNGCGKTSVLLSLKEYLEGFYIDELSQLEDWKHIIESERSSLNKLEESFLNNDMPEINVNELEIKKQQIQESISRFESKLKRYSALQPNFSGIIKIMKDFPKGGFLISFFDAKRSSTIASVEGSKKLNLPKVSPISSNQLSSQFVQFLVNQESRADHFYRKGNKEGVAEFEEWKGALTKRFRSLFMSEELELEYDIDTFDYTINIPGREPFRLTNNELSDGYSAVIQIIAELLLRMEAVTSGKYDVPGIVLIDEIETHLHIELQKEILPFLTDFFPNIQFIVTTHSPFVLTSLPDSVVFDLESGKRWENLAPLSASTVVEEYFDSDLYSKESVTMLSRYETLSQKERSEDEELEYRKLRELLEAVEYDRSPELVSHFEHLKAKETNK